MALSWARPILPTIAKLPYRAPVSSRYAARRSAGSRWAQSRPAISQSYPNGKAHPTLEEELRQLKDDKSWQYGFATVIGLMVFGGLVVDDLVFRRGGFHPVDNGMHQFQLVAKQPVSENASILYFDYNPKDPAPVRWLREKMAIRLPIPKMFTRAWNHGLIWSVELVQPQLQIVRAYTPLPQDTDKTTGNASKAPSRLKFLVRHDQRGEMSSYLTKLEVGANIDLSDPKFERVSMPRSGNVVFFAGGTGIAPALQVAHILFESKKRRLWHEEEQKPRKLHILWASRSRQDCLGGQSSLPPVVAPQPVQPAQPAQTKASWLAGWWRYDKEPAPAPAPSSASVSVAPTPKVSREKQGLIVKELEALKARYPGQVTVDYFVDEEDTWIDYQAISRALTHSLSDGIPSNSSDKAPQERKLFVSGPPGFLNYLAGPKEWRSGREQQGPLGGLLANAVMEDPRGISVWKL